MSIPSVYINLEDDVSKIVTRLKHASAKQVVLVCPKRCFLFNDSINLRLLKKQTDLLGKEIFILTMDERGQLYSKEAGFQLKFLPKSTGSQSMSDIKTQKTASVDQSIEKEAMQNENPLQSAVSGLKHMAEKLVAPAVVKKIEEESVSPKKKTKNSPIPKVKVTDSFFPKEIEENYKSSGLRKNHSNKIITSIVAVTLIVALLLVFVILPKASVVVYAKTEPVTRDMEISMSVNVSSADPSKLVMPATKVEEPLSLSGKYESQGKNQIGNKASGTVKIYNFTKLPLNLKAATTILTVGSKNFNLVNDISGLKPTIYKNQKTKEVDINSLGESVQIIAASGGDDSNLPAGTRMEISNQVFGSKPQLLYAKTDSEITGGTTRYLSVISQDDITSAKNDLQEKALQQVQDKLASQGLELPEKSYSLDVSDFSTDNPVGSETPSFQATMQAKLTGIAFKKDDLKNLIWQRISQTLATNKTLEQKTPDSTMIKVKSYDPVTLLAVLTVHFEGNVVFDADLSNIESELVGKSQVQVNEILRSKAEIDKVEITLAPSWQRNFPWFAQKINVTLAKDSQNN